MLPSPLSAPLPPPPPSLIGRESEIAQLTAMLQNPDCRLITVVGSGGVGKTSLALFLASWLNDFFPHGVHAFPDGVHFLHLETVDSAAHLAASLAEGIGLSLYGWDDYEALLINGLKAQAVLLVLDNFEHLLDGAALLVRLLHAAPGLKLLVTSREVLSVRQEWVFALQGLSFTAEHDPAEIVPMTAASRLFIERARRLRPTFFVETTDADYVHIPRICRLTDGIPLAIELAAAWVHVLSCAEIADELERGIEILSTSLRDVPPRHRSLRAAFDHSWKLLTPAHRDALCRLAVFRSPVRREAAEAVAGATLPVLSALIDKSLLQRVSDGRYRLHNLLRQYAVEYLEAEALEAAHDAHAAYYADWLHQLHPLLERDPAAVALVAAELDDVRAMWTRAVSHKRPDWLWGAFYALFDVHDFRGHYDENRRTFESAISAIEHAPAIAPPRLLPALLTALGWIYIRVGQVEGAKTQFRRANHLYSLISEHPPSGAGTNPLGGLAAIANLSGDHAEAIRLAQELYAHSTSHGDGENKGLALHLLTEAYLGAGHFDEALLTAQAADKQARETGNRWLHAYILIDWGDAEHDLGDIKAAQKLYLAAYDIKQAFHDAEGRAVALNRLAALALTQGETERAAALYRQTETIYRDIGDRGGLATSLYGLGRVMRRHNRMLLARDFLNEALNIAKYILWQPLTHDIERELAALDAAQQPGHHTEGVEQDGLIEKLSSRELEVLRLLVDGLSNAEIAERLVLSVGTVKAHNHHIFGKLGVNNRMRAVYRAQEIGLV